MIVSMNVSHFVKICQVLTILHQLICRGVTNFGTQCTFGQFFWPLQYAAQHRPTTYIKLTLNAIYVHDSSLSLITAYDVKSSLLITLHYQFLTEHLARFCHN